MENNWLTEKDYINPFPYFYKTTQYYIAWCILYVYLQRGFNLSLLLQLPPAKRNEGLSRICSSLQASIISSWSMAYLLDIIDYELWTHIIPISASFGIFDLYIITIDYKNYKTKYIGYLTHHTLLIFGPLVMTAGNSKLVCQTYLFEITVPFLDIAWLLYNTGLNNTILFKVMSVISVIFFLVFRVLNNSYLVYQTMYNKDFIIMIIAIIFYYLNISWFVKLVKLFLKV